jgi:hypothetical protein
MLASAETATNPAHIVTPSTTVQFNMSVLAIAGTERRGGTAEPASERPKGAPHVHAA